MFSYSGNFEDVMLYRAFKDVPKGFYIDIGASDPVACSVTKLFYELGWRGINIEPSESISRLQADRPEDINLQLAVYDRAGTISLIEEANTGMSRVSAEGADGVDEPPGSVRKEVPCDTLDNIVARFAPDTEIDFLKIDAEGSEARIIASTDWTRIRPKIIVAEATLPWTNVLSNQDWEPILLGQGYLRAYFDGINCFYVRKESAELMQTFSVPVNQLDQFKSVEVRTLMIECDHAREEAKTRAAEIRSLNRKVQRLEKKAARYDALIDELHLDHGPRALRVALKLARFLRAVSQATRMPFSSR